MPDNAIPSLSLAMPRVNAGTEPAVEKLWVVLVADIVCRVTLPAARGNT
jgi:hypothetical protein